MGFAEDQAEELKRLFPGVKYCEEGGCDYFLLPRLVLPEGCAPSLVDALLCPTPRDGYSSRLFFAEKIQARGNPNWNGTAFRILERNWQVYSWRTHCDSLRLAQMIPEHLRGLG